MDECQTIRHLRPRAQTDVFMKLVNHVIAIIYGLYSAAKVVYEYT
jgi:hypothetical protein